MKRKNLCGMENVLCLIDRVIINKKLTKGKYTQCYGCRRPLNDDETRSIYYEKGVSCQYCFHERSQDQKKDPLQDKNKLILRKITMTIIHLKRYLNK